MPNSATPQNRSKSKDITVSQAILSLLVYLFFKVGWYVNLRRVNRIDRIHIGDSAIFAMAAAPTDEAYRSAVKLAHCQPLNYTAYIALKMVADAKDDEKHKYILAYYVGSLQTLHGLNEDDLMDRMLEIEADVYNTGTLTSGRQHFKQKPFVG